MMGWWNWCVLQDDLYVLFLKNDPALRSAASPPIENFPAIDDPAALSIRPSIPQIMDIRFLAPLNKGALTAVIDEWHQTVRTAHLDFSHFAGKTIFI